MKVMLSSIAKNDIKVLMRIFNVEEENKGFYFLEFLKESVLKIIESYKIGDKIMNENLDYKAQKFSLNIHYIIENEENLLVTAVFKEKTN